MSSDNKVSRRDFIKTAAVSVAGVSLAGMPASGKAENSKTNNGASSMKIYQKPTGEPYKLLGKRLVFTNWLFIRPGSFGWFNKDGKNVTVGGSEDAWGANMRRSNFPTGIHLKAIKAEKLDEPIFKPEKPWEDSKGYMVNTILQEDGKYRAWFGSAYAESKDGINWDRPNLGIKEHNQLDMSFVGGSVFIDPSAPSGERYKWVGGGGLSKEAFEEYKKTRPDDWEHRADRPDVGHLMTITGAVSPDGYHWSRLPNPLTIEHSDTHITAYYDQVLEKYVIYTRNYMIGQKDEEGHEGFRMWWDIGRRSIGRTESDNFQEFPVSDVILVPTPDMAPSDVLYTNGRTCIPGAPDHHLMFPDVWHTFTDTTSTLLASSHNGINWNYLPGGYVIETSEFEKWDGGCHFTCPNLLELPNGDFALPYNGYIFPHKYPRGQWKMACGYAIWKKGRIIALCAPEYGEFTTVGFIAPGRKIKINAVTKRAGSIKIEVCDFDVNTINGRSFDDCDPIIGDVHNRFVTWKGKDDLGYNEGSPVVLKFKMDNAEIYGLDFE
ncbi:MAG: twin-arginine translocation signal domain-containing protein [Armatimonadota bacterium]